MSNNSSSSPLDSNAHGAGDLIAAAAAVEQEQPPSKLPKLNVDINRDVNNVASAPNDYMDIDTAQNNVQEGDAEDYGIPPLSPVVNPEVQQGEVNVGNFKTEGDVEGIVDVSGGGGKKQRKGHKEFTAEGELI